jgi:hypothetical protein
VYVKDYDSTPSVREFRCPSCRALLLFRSDRFGLELKTASEYAEQRAQEARDEVALQLLYERKRRENELGVLVGELHEIQGKTTLDDLQKAFAQRASGGEAK